MTANSVLGAAYDHDDADGERRFGQRQHANEPVAVALEDDGKFRRLHAGAPSDRESGDWIESSVASMRAGDSSISTVCQKLGPETARAVTERPDAAKASISRVDPGGMLAGAVGPDSSQTMRPRYASGSENSAASIPRAN